MTKRKSKSRSSLRQAAVREAAIKQIGEAITLVHDENGWTAADSVNHPPHYNSHPSGVECITVTEHMNFNLGNAVKYIWRADLKSDDPITDLEKARWYVEREIARLRKGRG